MVEFSDSEIEETYNTNQQEFEDRCDTVQETSEPENLSENLQFPQDVYIGRDQTTVWEKEPNFTAINVESPLNPFPSVKPYARNITDEFSAFTKLFDDVIVEEIVNNTNINIGHRRSTRNHSRNNDVTKDTDKYEIYALIGLLYLSGAQKERYRNLSELWTKGVSGLEIFRAVMTHRRFVFLLECIRFDDKRTRKLRLKVDKLTEISNVWEKFVKNCIGSYSPSQFLSVNEKLCPFKGKCSFIRTNRDKPDETYIKLIMLADTKTFFTCNVNILLSNDESCRNNSDVIHQLLHYVKGKNKNVTLNTRYTTYKLVTSLLNDKITVIGTVKKNQRELPLEFTPRNARQTNTTLYGFQNRITLVSHVPENNKAIILYTTLHHEPLLNQVTDKPQALIDYTVTKTTVDTINKACDLFTVSRPTRRWSLALFYALLDIAGINSQILYDASKGSMPQNRQVYLTQLAFALVQPIFLKGRNNPISLGTERANLRFNDVASKPKGRCALCGRMKDVTTTLRCNICCKFICKKHMRFMVHICENCDKNKQSFNGQTGNEALEVQLRKRGRCNLCGRAKDVSTTLRCDTCFKFTCKRHMTFVKNTCEKCNN